MKSTVKIVTLALVLAASLVGPATAGNMGKSLRGVVQSATTSGNVNLSEDNGVVTLFGWVDSAVTKQAIKRAVSSHDGVTSIIDLISISN